MSTRMEMVAKQVAIICVKIAQTEREVDNQGLGMTGWSGGVVDWWSVEVVKWSYEVVKWSGGVVKWSDEVVKWSGGVMKWWSDEVAE